jgi:beta-glucosidase
MVGFLVALKVCLRENRKPVGRPRRHVFLLPAVALLCVYGIQGTAQKGQSCTSKTCDYLNPSLPAANRAKDLVSRMTLDEKVSQTLSDAAAIPRLGVPEYNWWNEALHGVARNGFATTFPQAIGLAATWDTALMSEVGDTISTEGPREVQ